LPAFFAFGAGEFVEKILEDMAEDVVGTGVIPLDRSSRRESALIFLRGSLNGLTSAATCRSEFDGANQINDAAETLLVQMRAGVFPRNLSAVAQSGAV
jgi:hypothetical protein